MISCISFSSYFPVGCRAVINEMIQDKKGFVFTVLQAIISGMFQEFQGEISQKRALFLQLGL